MHKITCLFVSSAIMLSSCQEAQENEKVSSQEVETEQEVGSNIEEDSKVKEQEVAITEVYNNGQEKVTIQFDKVSPVKKEIINAGTDAEMNMFDAKYDFSPTSAQLVSVMEFKNPPKVEDLEDYLNYMKKAMSGDKVLSKELTADLLETKILNFCAYQENGDIYSCESIIFWNEKLIKLVTMQQGEASSEDMHKELVGTLKLDEL